MDLRRNVDDPSFYSEHERGKLMRTFQDPDLLQKLRAVCFLSLLIIPFSAHSQSVGINTSGAAPDPSAMLDVAANDKGVLIPRVELNDVTTQAPISAAPVEGLLIYNDAGSAPLGFYYWDGSQWIKFATGASGLNSNFVLNGDSLEITDPGGTLKADLSPVLDSTDPDSVIGNEYNTDFYLSGNTLSVEDPGNTFSVDLSSYADSTDADSLTNNEAINSVNLNASNELVIDEAGSIFTQDLSSLLDSSYWDRDQSNGYLFPKTLSDKVGIGTNTPSGRLHVSFDNGAGEFPVIDKANGSGYGPLTRWFGYSTTHDLTLGYDGDYNWSTSSSSKHIRYDLTVGNDLYAETSNGDSLLYVNGGDNTVGLATNPSGPAVITPPTVEVWGPGEWGVDNGNATQATIGYWWSSDVAIMPESDGYGYVGYNAVGNNYAWREMNAYGFTNVSARDKKRKVTRIDGALRNKVMEDIEKVKPSFYYYNIDPKSFSEEPSRYRAQMRLGLLADEAPDYLLSRTFQGIDIYAVSTLALAGVKKNHQAIQRIEEEQGSVKRIRDFGTAKMEDDGKLRVTFSESFREKLQGKTPILELTPYDPGARVGIQAKGSEGFTLITDEKVEKLQVDWVAHAKVQREDKNKGGPEGIDPELERNLDVPKAEKERIIEFQKSMAPSRRSDQK